MTLTPTSAGVFPVPVVVSSPTPDPDAADRTADTVLVQPGPSQLERAGHQLLPAAARPPGVGGRDRLLDHGLPEHRYDLRYRVPLAIIAGTEHRAIRIKAAYAAILGRQPSKAGVTYWVRSARQGASVRIAPSDPHRFRRVPPQPRVGERHGWHGLPPGRTVGYGRRRSRLGRRVSQGRSSGSQAAALPRTTEARNRIMEARYQTTLERRPDDFERFLWFSAIAPGESSDQQWKRLLSGFSYLRQFPEVYDGYITPSSTDGGRTLRRQAFGTAEEVVRVDRAGGRGGGRRPPPRPAERPWPWPGRGGARRSRASPLGRTAQGLADVVVAIAPGLGHEDHLVDADLLVRLQQVADLVQRADGTTEARRCRPCWMVAPRWSFVLAAMVRSKPNADRVPLRLR